MIQVTGTPGWGTSKNPAEPCSTCGFALWNPILTPNLPVSHLGLYSDARFPGRSIMRLRQHAEDLSELTPEQAAAFMEDIRSASAAIKHATGADRVNVAILGNTVPHLHAHLIPRRRDRDSHPDRSPWDDTREKTEMAPDALAEMSHAISIALGEPKRDRGTHPDVTRVEVIGRNGGRLFVGRFDDRGADLSVQDDRRTLKLFMGGDPSSPSEVSSGGVIFIDEAWTMRGDAGKKTLEQFVRDARTPHTLGDPR